jgi:hypothetical protein
VSASTQTQALSAILFLYRNVIAVGVTVAHPSGAGAAADPVAGCADPG